MKQPLLDVQTMQLAFGDKVVLHDVSFQIAPAEKVALVGESGSGKTVTALSLLRLLSEARLQGTARFASAEGEVDLLSMPLPQLRGLRGRDIAMIFQEPMSALNPLYSIGAQIIEVLQLKLGLERRQARQRALALLADTGIPEPERRVDAYPHQLSGGQRQRVMIAMALACQPRLLLADEPSTALDAALRSQILDLLDRLQQQHGMAVLMITHDLHLVRRFASRVIVMQHGQIVEHGPVAEVFTQPQHPYTRSLLDSRPQRKLQQPPAVGAAPLLQARAVRVSYPVPLPGWRGWWRKGEFVAVRGADFDLAPGQTLGVIGESGSGKTSLALAALGLLPCTGELRVQGRSWQRSRARNKSLRRAVQVVFQDPYSSLSPRLNDEEIVGEGLRVHEPALSALERRQRVRQILQEVGLDEARHPALLQRYPHEFSGGQRQRLAIARALIVQPRLLVLDEPTSALDVSIQKQVLELLQQLQQEKGLSYLLITHDVDVIRAMAHAVLVMKDGAIVEAGPAQELLQAPSHPYTRSLIQISGL